MVAPSDPPKGVRKATPVQPPPPEPAPSTEAPQERPTRPEDAAGAARRPPRTSDQPGGGRGRGGKSGGEQRGGKARSGADRGGRSGAGDVGRQTRRSTPATPGAPGGKPLGAERAQRRADAPPRRPSKPKDEPPRPDLPVGDQIHLPKAVRRDLERTLGPGRRGEEVALALSVGSAAIEEGVVDVALEMLAWVKHMAPRVAAVREAYGVARYLAEDYAGALTELQAYVRISGRVDQNHVIADCQRALSRGVDKVEAAARPLIDDDRSPADRRAEASIVLAAALADAGDVAAGREELRTALAERRDRDAEHHLRLRSLAADLALRAGDRDAARRHLEVLVAGEQDGAYDAVSRLAELD